MTAAEAIELLRDMPPDAPLVVRIGSREKAVWDVALEEGEVIITGN